MVNVSQNRLSTKSIDFINYYHTFFKLVSKAFCPLFYNIIYFNLSDFDSYISFICSTYHCVLSDVHTLKTLVIGAKNTYSEITCCINQLKCSVCLYADKLNSLKCAIKKIVYHFTIPPKKIEQINAKLTVQYKIKLSELKNSIKTCTSQITSNNFEDTQLTSICNRLSTLKSCICSDINLLLCLKYDIQKFNMFDSNVCKLKKFILCYIPRLESAINYNLVCFNKDIQDKTKKLETVKSEILKLEQCVQQKLDALNKIVGAGITINGFSLRHEITVVCDPPKLTQDPCYTQIKCRLLQKKQALEKSKSDTDNLKFKEGIQKIKRGASSISELLFDSFIRCSLKSLSNHVINTKSPNLNSFNIKPSVDSHNVAMNILSRVVMDETIFVITRLYRYYKTKSQIFEILSGFQKCDCIKSFDSKFIKTGLYKKFMKGSFNTNVSNEYYLHKDIDNTENHICLCLVMKYVLLTDIYVINNYNDYIYYDILSWISRKHNKYTYLKIETSISKVIKLIISVIYQITIRIKNIYVENTNCFCKNENKIYYNYLISIILWVSSLIENIWRADNNSMVTAINCLSNVFSEFDKISPYKIKGNNEISDDPVKYLFCPINFCKISSKLHVILDFVSISLYDPNLSSAIKSYIYNLSLANLDSFKNYIKNLYNSGNNNSFKSHSKWFLNKYNSTDGSPNICGQVKNQCCLLSSNVLLYMCILISFVIKTKLYKEKSDQIKERLCGFLNCICDCKNNECCIKQIIDLIPKICNGQENNCQKLLDECIKQCCENNCCNDGCPCNKLKDSCGKLKEVCCNSTNGLCKILEELSKCLKEGSCNNNCRCCCCKIVIEGILIIQEMFKLNVSNISKNIIVKCKYFLETMIRIKIDKDVDLIINTIEKNIRYNKRSLKIAKNTVNSYTDHKNIANRFLRVKIRDTYENV